VVGTGGSTQSYGVVVDVVVDGVVDVVGVPVSVSLSAVFMVVFPSFTFIGGEDDKQPTRHEATRIGETWRKEYM
jgi:hypothetical protein